MADIDLIPKRYLLERLLRRRIRWLLAALLAIVCATGAIRAALWYAGVHEHKEIARLRASEHDSARTKAKVQELAQQKLAANRQLEVLDDLRGRDRMRLLFEALDAAFLNGVWFDELRSLRAAAAPAQPTAGAPALPSGAAAAAPPAVPAGAAKHEAQRVELTGHAVDHSRLAAFMGRLGAQPEISDVQLLDTSTRTYSTASVVDFKVSLRVAPKGRP